MPDHSDAYRRRRFLNWFPLGLTYATFYMGRYNFNVFKGQFAEMYHFDKAQVGVIATAGFWTYALSGIFNGPLPHKLLAAAPPAPIRVARPPPHLSRTGAGESARSPHAPKRARAR